jgi:prolyl-tRNA synthetase
MEKKKTAVPITREENYPEWYQQVIKLADLAENSEVRGCMVIKPWGYAIWENIRKQLDKMFRETGHKNAYFPLFIPKSYFEKEAEHVKGFAKECAVVTHSRLEEDGKGGLKIAGELSEELIVRPTSETIIGSSFSKWVNSYRDLPLLINQWANVVRWEMRTRLFLRTAEFLWQEGHTAHESKKEAWFETMQMLAVYAKFAEEYLAIPVIKGEKTESERFPGAENTFCIEAMMQDKKALQAGTSHFLGQKFAKASNIKFQTRNGAEELAWTTSWGVSTRLIGALIMAHSDDNGLILPPKIAPAHLVFIPIFKNDEQKCEVYHFIRTIILEIEKLRFWDEKIQYEIDERDVNSGEKNWYWIKKGIPLRLEIGPRDVKNNSIYVGRRDKEPQDKQSYSKEELIDQLVEILNNIQCNYFTKAQKFLTENTKVIDNKEQFYAFFTPNNELQPEIHGGFCYSHWCGSAECESSIKNELKVTIRCIPLEKKEEDGNCIYCGKNSHYRVLYAKSY